MGEEEEEEEEGYLIQRHKNSPPALPPSLPPSSLPFRKGTREAPTFTSAVYYLSRPPRASSFSRPILPLVPAWMGRALTSAWQIDR